MDSLAALIERAAVALGVDKSVFLRNAIAKEAQRVIKDSSRHVLTADDARLFSTALDTPAPTPILTDEHRTALAATVEAGPKPDMDGIGRRLWIRSKAGLAGETRHQTPHPRARPG